MKDMSMKVKELKEILANLDDDCEIILQKDSEGNAYSPLSCSGMGYYIPDSTWSGEVYDADWSAYDCCLTEEEWYKIKNSTPLSIILVPVN